MAMHLFNTMTRAKKLFKPIASGRVKMYVCGPTVYDHPHLGHARSAVVYDVARRYLKAGGHQVVYVRNITDIDEKIIDQARLKNQDYRALSAYYIREYNAAMARLNVLPPDVEPRASDFIRPIQDLIGAIIQKGHAYRSGGNVYFAVESVKGYGRLSGRGIRPTPADGDPAAGTGKRHPADFALWRQSKPLSPSWPSPWGRGRPGWHIECSAMSLQLLGEVFDIHGGGEDLIFPHHENEITQSLGLNGQIPAKYWMHHGLVNIGGRKMSKSLGNGLALNDQLSAYPAGVLRLLLLSKRYRHPLEFSEKAMRSAARSFARLARFFSRWDAAAVAARPVGRRPGSLWSRFCAAMDEDFNFPMALAVVFEGIRHINRELGKISPSGASKESADLKAPAADLAFMVRDILGFDFSPAARATTKQASSNLIDLEMV